MQSRRRSTLAIAASLAVAGIIAACGRDITSVPMAISSTGTTAPAGASLLVSTISTLAPDGSLHSFTDSLMVQQDRGVTRLFSDGPRTWDPSSAVITRDGRASMALGRAGPLVSGRTTTDRSGNERAVASFGGETGAPPGLTVFYRNGKAQYAMRSTHEQVNGQWVVTSRSSIFLDPKTGEPMGEIVIREGPTAQESGTALPPASLVQPAPQTSLGKPGEAVRDTPTTAYTCASADKCDVLREAADVAWAYSTAAYAAWQAANWTCALTQTEFACALAEAAGKHAIAAAKAAQFAINLYLKVCAGVPLFFEVDPANGGEVTSFLERQPTPAFYYEEGCDEGDPSGGGGGGDITCYQTWGKIEISYDGGASWETLWEGIITVCGDDM